MNQDTVNSPQHYTQHPSGVECIEITEHFSLQRRKRQKQLPRLSHRKNWTAAIGKRLAREQRKWEREQQAKQAPVPDNANGYSDCRSI